VLVFTDGVTEAMDAAGDLFGDERLREVIHAKRSEPATVILRGIWDAVKAHRDGSLDDDMTIVVVKGLM
jgi:sigma-B regulation protein RsbU (phosphoserine phosphatase)